MGVRRSILGGIAALTLVAASMHAWAMPEHFGEWWGYGVFFLVVAAAQGFYGVALLRRSNHQEEDPIPPPLPEMFGHRPEVQRRRDQRQRRNPTQDRPSYSHTETSLF